MTQKFTVLFDLDGTLIDTAPDLMNAHNHVMQKFGYETKSTDEIRNLVGKGAASMIGRSLWNQARKELKKIGIYNYFEDVAGYNTFDYCKPDPRHITTIIEILDGSKNKSIMIGDSESDANAAKAADIPMILLEDGYTEKNIDEIYHNHLVKDFIGIEKIISKYL